MASLAESTSPSAGSDEVTIQGPPNQPHLGLALFQSGDMSDIVISARGEKIRAHRLALKPVCTNLQDKLSQPEIKLNEDPYIVKFVLTFIYANAVKIPEVSLREVAAVAKSFGVSNLHILCVRDILLKTTPTPENCLDLLMQAHDINEDDLMERFLNVGLADLGSVKQSPGFTKLPEDLLKRYILHKDLKVRAPDQRLNLALKWVRADTHKRKSILSQILDSPVIARINPSFLEYILDDPIIEQLPHIQQKIKDLQIRVQEDDRRKADHSEAEKDQPTTKAVPPPVTARSVKPKIVKEDVSPAASPTARIDAPHSQRPPPGYTFERCLVFTGALISGRRSTDVYAVKLDDTLKTIKLGTFQGLFPPGAEYDAATNLVVQDNMMYLSGLGPDGREVWQHSIIANTSNLITRLQTGRDAHAMAICEDNQLLILGGISPPGSDDAENSIESVELVDLNKCTSIQVGNIKYKLCAKLSGYCEMEKVLLFGARDDDLQCYIQVWDIPSNRIIHTIKCWKGKAHPIYGIVHVQGYLLVVAYGYTCVAKMADLVQGKSESLTMCDNYVTPNTDCSVVLNNDEDKIILLGGRPKDGQPNHFVYEARVNVVLANIQTGWKKVMTPWNLGECEMNGSYNTAYITVPK